MSDTVAYYVIDPAEQAALKLLCERGYDVFKHNAGRAIVAPEGQVHAIVTPNTNIRQVYVDKLPAIS